MDLAAARGLSQVLGEVRLAAPATRAIVSTVPMITMITRRRDLEDVLGSRAAHTDLSS